MNTQFPDQSLQKIINTLSKNDNVDALLLCGTTATGTQTKNSDYDLVLVVKEKPDKLLSLFTYIDGLPADVFFYSIADIKRINGIYFGLICVIIVYDLGILLYWKGLYGSM